jgi:hypothetical protein
MYGVMQMSLRAFLCLVLSRAIDKTLAPADLLSSKLAPLSTG